MKLISWNIDSLNAALTGDSALHRFVGVFPCPQRCGSRYVLR